MVVVIWIVLVWRDFVGCWFGVVLGGLPVDFVGELRWLVEGLSGCFCISICLGLPGFDAWIYGRLYGCWQVGGWFRNGLLMVLALEVNVVGVCGFVVGLAFWAFRAWIAIVVLWWLFGVCGGFLGVVIWSWHVGRIVLWFASTRLVVVGSGSCGGVLVVWFWACVMLSGLVAVLDWL